MGKEGLVNRMAIRKWTTRHDLGAKEDRISDLPEFILIDILSLLNIMEAARTCAISKRWRYLWRHVTSLNIADDDVNEETRVRLNQVLQLHQSPTLEEFKLRSSSQKCFCITGGSQLDKWIEFAMRKRSIKRLEIDCVLKEVDRYNWYKFTKECYKLPENLFKSPFGVSCITSLTHLSLNYVNVTGELIEHFLSHGQLLQHLCVSGSALLVNLRISGSSLRLKFLQISDCVYLCKVDIFAPKLVTFIYDGVHRRGYKGGIFLEHAPSLVNVSLAEGNVYVTRASRTMFTCFRQLETLNLHLSNLDAKKIITLPVFPELTSVKNLSVNVNHVNYDDQLRLRGLTSMIERSPFLCSFTLQLSWKTMPQIKWPSYTRKLSKSHHQCLKVVKLSGFMGSVIENEFAKYLIGKAIMLEKVIIDLGQVIIHDESTAASDPGCLHMWAVSRERKKKLRDIRKQALKLGARLPSGAELIVT